MRIPEITGLDVAFGTTEGLPRYSDVPEEFKRSNNKWCKLFSQIFFSGGAGIQLIPNEGVDLGKAIRHIQGLMHSMEPKHEHKEAGVAYLMSQYFKDYKIADNP